MPLVRVPVSQSRDWVLNLQPDRIVIALLEQKH